MKVFMWILNFRFCAICALTLWFTSQVNAKDLENSEAYDLDVEFLEDLADNEDFESLHANDTPSEQLKLYDRQKAQDKAIETKDYKFADPKEYQEAMQAFNESNSRNRGQIIIESKKRSKTTDMNSSDKYEGALVSSFSAKKKAKKDKKLAENKPKVTVKSSKNKDGVRDNTQYKNRANSLSGTFK